MVAVICWARSCGKRLPPLRIVVAVRRTVDGRFKRQLTSHRNCLVPTTALNPHIAPFSKKKKRTDQGRPGVVDKKHDRDTRWYGPSPDKPSDPEVAGFASRVLQPSFFHLALHFWSPCRRHVFEAPLLSNSPPWRVHEDICRTPGDAHRGRRDLARK